MTKKEMRSQEEIIEVLKFYREMLRTEDAAFDEAYKKLTKRFHFKCVESVLCEHDVNRKKDPKLHNELYNARVFLVNSFVFDRVVKALEWVLKERGDHT